MDPDPEKPNEQDVRKSHRENLKDFLSNPKVHIVGLCLIVADVLLVLMLLFVDLNVIPAPGNNEDEKHKNKHLIESVLHYIGLTILVIFTVEVILKIVAEGKSFFTQKLEVFDAVIVWLSFILDIALTIAPVSKFVRDAVILLILLRLWRFSKLLTSIFICVKRGTINELEQEQAARKAAERERDDLKQELEDLKHELRNISVKPVV